MCFLSTMKVLLQLQNVTVQFYILKSLNEEMIFKVQTYWHAFNKLTASVTAERALPMLKLALKSVRAVSENEKALVNDSVMRENFTSIILRSENSDFSTQT